MQWALIDNKIKHTATFSKLNFSRPIIKSYCKNISFEMLTGVIKFKLCMRKIKPFLHYNTCISSLFTPSIGMSLYPLITTEMCSMKKYINYRSLCTREIKPSCSYITYLRPHYSQPLLVFPYAP